MDENQDREAFEKAVTQEGLHVNLTKIGPASLFAGEYADPIVQTCWNVWKLALAYAREQDLQKGATLKAQFQVDHGSGWKTIAEVGIHDGSVQPPNAWTMVRALGKRIVYTGSVSKEE